LVNVAVPAGVEVGDAPVGAWVVGVDAGDLELLHPATVKASTASPPNSARVLTCCIDPPFARSCGQVIAKP
jgi:hypothetical protein